VEWWVLVEVGLFGSLEEGGGAEDGAVEESAIRTFELVY
jgi:hypothetical protein